MKVDFKNQNSDLLSFNHIPLWETLTLKITNHYEKQKKL